MVRAALEAAGAHVNAVGSAPQARQVLSEKCPDVLISDIAMPDEDGYSLLRSLRASDVHVPAIALTAYARAEDTEEAKAAGFQVHITKPVTPAHLIETVAELALASQSKALELTRTSETRYRDAWTPGGGPRCQTNSDRDETQPPEILRCSSRCRLCRPHSEHVPRPSRYGGARTGSADYGYRLDAYKASLMRWLHDRFPHCGTGFADPSIERCAAMGADISQAVAQAGCRLIARSWQTPAILPPSTHAPSRAGLPNQGG